MGNCTIFLMILICVFTVVLVIILLDFFGTIELDDTERCKTPSITVASGFSARNGTEQQNSNVIQYNYFDFLGKYCPGDLIFVDNFDHFNVETWEHEITLAGDGVCTFFKQIQIHTYYQFCNFQYEEFQYYTNNRSNSYVENGKLYIRPTLLDNFDEEFLENGILNIQGSYPVEA